jgi:hypothetical protein
MIKLTIDPQVLTKLQQAFPVPANSASRALAKYSRALEGLIFSSVQRGLLPLQQKLGLYPISLHDLANKGGRIGPQKLRLHKWLKDNQLELVKTVEKGSKFSGEYSTVKLTKLVTLENKVSVSRAVVSEIKSDRELSHYLTGASDESYAVFKYLYPELEPSVQPEPVAGFDLVPVDVESLKAFIVWLSDGVEFGTKEKRQQVLSNAKLVLAAASINGNFFPQRLKPSPFGRTYYEGVSIQNVHKELRRAVLGNCWEYDMRSSVVAWKMGYAASMLLRAKVQPDVRGYFPATTLFLEDKADFMSTVRYFTFDADSLLSPEFQFALIKQALTAISFGAKSTGAGWLDGRGQWHNPALVNILMNKTERERFLSDPTVKAYIEEQRALDDFIYSQAKLNLPNLMSETCVHTASGRPSKSKVLSYLYQHAETAAMNLVCTVARAYGHEPIARVHDAVFFRCRIGADLKQEIELVLQQATCNKYWHLSPKQLKRYMPVSLDAVMDEYEHKQRIAAEERRAIEYFSSYSPH